MSSAHACGASEDLDTRAAEVGRGRGRGRGRVRGRVEVCVRVRVRVRANPSPNPNQVGGETLSFVAELTVREATGEMVGRG